MKGILGRKVGMTEKFTKDGKIIPVTVVAVDQNVIMQVKTAQKDGYNAIQIGFTDKKENRTTKAEMGQAKKANTAPKRFLKEIKISSPENYTVGNTITADIFEVGERVDVTGTSKGKGFQGVIKRHGQSRGPETHGSRYHRRPGSMGTMRPMRVMPGKKLAGHMGNETITIQNLTIVEVDTNLDYILVSGNIPGAKNSVVLIKESVKTGNKETFELVSYETEADEIVEETNVESTEVAEEQTNVESTEAAEEQTQIEEVKEETTEEVEEPKEETASVEESK